MEPDTMASLLFLLVIAALGFITMKAAEVRRAKGSPVPWFIGGAMIPLVALPAALLPLDLQLDPNRKLDRVLLKIIDLNLKIWSNRDGRY
jgi:hypothetical protein